VPGGAWQVATARPATVAIHDASDVKWSISLGVHRLPTIASDDGSMASTSRSDVG
jgi:hypothetical protein